MTASHRRLPDFLIIGAQRCGTSSLYKHLGAHPQIVPSLRKETRYFSIDYHRGLSWYRAHFPMAAALQPIEWIRGAARTFEATPDYLFDPRSPVRIRDTIPDALFVILLRDPVERAYSHWQHMCRLGFEPLPFPEAVAAEPERITTELQALRRGVAHPARNALRFSYLARGCYAEQLSRWFDVFPREQFLIIAAEEFYADPAAIMAKMCHFMGVDEWRPAEFRNYSRSPRSHTGVSQGRSALGALEDDLREHFSKENRDLAKLAERPFPW